MITVCLRRHVCIASTSLTAKLVGLYNENYDQHHVPGNHKKLYARFLSFVRQLSYGYRSRTLRSIRPSIGLNVFVAFRRKR